jgi:hypothetical protein
MVLADQAREILALVAAPSTALAAAMHLRQRLKARR